MTTPQNKPASSFIEAIERMILRVPIGNEKGDTLEVLKEKLAIFKQNELRRFRKNAKALKNALASQEERHRGEKRKLIESCPWHLCFSMKHEEDGRKAMRDWQTEQLKKLEDERR